MSTDDESISFQRRIALEGELQERAWDAVQMHLERSPRHPLIITRWNRGSSELLFRDTYRLDDALPDEDDDQLFVIRQDGERFEIEVEVTLTTRQRRPEPDPETKDAG
jgi:hypothetical protein